MNEENNLEFIKSKCSKMTAILNGIYLHSMSNPLLEASRFAQSKKDLMEKKRTLLILGLGLGYHIHSICQEMNSFYSEGYDIIIVEPNKTLCERFENTSKNIKIINEHNVKKIYYSNDFVQFLKTSPGIIIHPGSFSAQKDFFQEFLKFRNNSDNQSIINEIVKEENLIIDVFKNYENDMDIKDIILSLKNKLEINKQEKIILAYNSMK